METLTFAQLTGVLGFCGYITAYATLQFGILRGDANPHALLNVASASLVLFSLTEHFNLASALIQVCWIGIGLSGILYRSIRRSRQSSPTKVKRFRSA